MEIGKKVHSEQRNKATKKYKRGAWSAGSETRYETLITHFAEEAAAHQQKVAGLTGIHFPPHASHKHSPIRNPFRKPFPNPCLTTATLTTIPQPPPAHFPNAIATWTVPPLAFCLLQLQRSGGEGGSGSGVAGKAAHECIAKRRSIFTITRHLMQVGITMDDATNRCGSCIRMGPRARKIFEAAVARRRLRVPALKYATTDTL